jgi:uncharacterized membrane protein
MGPMGSMMGGWPGSGAAATDWLTPLVLVLLVLVVASVALVAWQSGGPRANRRSRQPEEILQERFARGELTRQQYQEGLVDLLRGRYVRGEIDVEAYETRVERLFGVAHPGSDRIAGGSGHPVSNGETANGPTGGGSQ